MAQLFEILSTLPRRDFAAGETIIAEDSTTGMLFFLIKGEVEVFQRRGATGINLGAWLGLW